MTPDELFKGLRRFENDDALKKKILFLVDEWVRVFPEVNYKHEIQLAHYWLVTHGQWKKRHDIFLSNWMKKADEIKKTKPIFGSPIIHKKYVERIPDEKDVMTGDDFAELRQTLRGKYDEPKTKPA